MREKILERLKLSDNMMAHRPMLRIVDMVLEMVKDNYPNNDKAMKSEMINDLEENYNYTAEEAEEWVTEHGSRVVDGMWNDYTSYLEQFAIYRG